MISPLPWVSPATALSVGVGRVLWRMEMMGRPLEPLLSIGVASMWKMRV